MDTHELYKSIIQEGPLGHRAKQPPKKQSCQAAYSSKFHPLFTEYSNDTKYNT